MNGSVHSHFHGAFELPSIARPTENSTLTISRLMRGSAVVGCAQAQFPEKNGVTGKTRRPMVSIIFRKRHFKTVIRNLGKHNVSVMPHLHKHPSPLLVKCTSLRTSDSRMSKRRRGASIGENSNAT